MWFIGLVLGLIAGSIGGIGGAFVGAVIGAFVASALAKKSPPESAARVTALELEMRKLNERVAALEAGAPLVAGSGAADAAAAPPVPELPQLPQPLVAMPLAPADVSQAAAARVAADVLPLAMPATDVVDQSTRTPAVALEAATVSSEITQQKQTVTMDSQVEEATPPVAPAPADRQSEVPPEPPAPAVPAAPSVLSLWWKRLIGGNIVAKIGVIILFFGVSFLLKYAYDHALLPPPLRLEGVACAGLAMLYVGWRLTATRRLYGLIMQGGGIGVLYVDVYFALKVFALLHPTVAFGLFMLLGVVATLLAVRQDAKVLAVLGLTGAFLAPILASRGGGNYVMLFSYYTLLNSFILVISWFKSWRDLNLTGFIFTFIVALMWGSGNYTPDKFSSVEPFVLIFFGMYLVIPILFATRQPPQLKGLVDGTLVFGTPLSVSFMQASLVRDIPNGLAWSAGVACALYALLAALTIRREGMRLLSETYIALSVVFGTLAIFFALDAYPTFALWTLEGAAIVWVGLRQQRLLARVFGYALQGAGAVYFLMQYDTYALTHPWFNDFILGCVLIAAAGFITAGLMHKHRAVLSAPGQTVIWALLAWASLWWTVAGLHSTHHALPWGSMLSALLGFTAVSFLVFEFIGARLRWPELRHLSHLHLPALVLIGGAMMTGVVNYPEQSVHPFANAGFVTWPLNFCVMFWAYYRQRADGLLTAGNARYFVAWLVIGVLATWEVAWLQWHEYYRAVLAWAGAGFGIAWLRFAWRERDVENAVSFSAVIAWWSAAWWFCGGFAELSQTVAGHGYQLSAQLALCGVMFAAFEWLGARLRWDALRNLAIAHMPMVIGFMALWMFARHAHPFEFGGFVTWPLNFVVLFWCMERRHQRPASNAYIFRFVVAWVLMVLLATVEALWSIQHQHFAAAMGLALLGGAAAYLCHTRSENSHRGYTHAGVWTLAWSLVFWVWPGLKWIGDELAVVYQIAACLGFAAVSVALCEGLGRWLRWPHLRLTQCALLPAMLMAVIWQLEAGTHPTAYAGWAAWLFVAAVFYGVLLRQQRDDVAVAGNAQHVMMTWLICFLPMWELRWQFDAAGWGAGWHTAVRGAVPATAVLLILSRGRQRWPWSGNFEYFLLRALGPLVIFGVLWSLAVLGNPAQVNPLPYVPLLNCVDLTQALSLLALWRWFESANQSLDRVLWKYWKHFVTVMGFLWVNALVLRAIHHWTGVAYYAPDLFRSVAVQTSFSLLWTTTAFALMVIAARKRYRYLWFTGAALLSVVVVKLFLFDLANTGTIARIVSFMGVGGLLMWIGYKVPVPPGDVESGNG